jgi:hypothetical protein
MKDKSDESQNKIDEISVANVSNVSTYISIGSIYRHFKGKEYKILALGKDSETLEDVVVYQALYNSNEFGLNSIWVRPKKMFLEIIDKDGKKIKRFEKIN